MTDPTQKPAIRILIARDPEITDPVLVAGAVTQAMHAAGAARAILVFVYEPNLAALLRAAVGTGLTGSSLESHAPIAQSDPSLNTAFTAAEIVSGGIDLCLLFPSKPVDQANETSKKEMWLVGAAARLGGVSTYEVIDKRLRSDDATQARDAQPLSTNNPRSRQLRTAVTLAGVVVLTAAIRHHKKRGRR